MHIKRLYGIRKWTSEYLLEKKETYDNLEIYIDK